MTITKQQLDAYLGKAIGAICGNHYDSPADNHCAHFVGHAMGYGFRYTCRQQSGGSSPGASIRVHELFAQCPRVGHWADLPATTVHGLVFVTDAKHVDL